MELNLVAPVAEGEPTRKGDEKLNGKWWRVKGPIESAEMGSTKFVCVSYVWGDGIDRAGSFFDCKRDISDRTKAALEAAMKAVDAMQDNEGGGKVEAFWIDAICVPQTAGSSRHGTLERYGFFSLDFSPTSTDVSKHGVHLQHCCRRHRGSPGSRLGNRQKSLGIQHRHATVSKGNGGS